MLNLLPGQIQMIQKHVSCFPALKIWIMICKKSCHLIGIAVPLLHQRIIISHIFCFQRLNDLPADFNMLRQKIAELSGRCDRKIPCKYIRDLVCGLKQPFFHRLLVRIVCDCTHQVHSGPVNMI